MASGSGSVDPRECSVSGYGEDQTESSHQVVLRMRESASLRTLQPSMDKAAIAGAVLVKNPGGPDTLSFEQVAVPWPKAGEVLLRQEAIGVNFVDIHHRRGHSRQPQQYPFIPGLEAAGVVVAVGKGVPNFKVGDRVTYSGGVLGAYSELRSVPATWLVPLPPHVSSATAAAALLKGMTAHVLLESAYPIKAGDTVLVHAAAGGVGSMLCQLASAQGAYVFGTVGSEDKIAHAKASGCHTVFVYTKQDFAEAVSAATMGMGVDAVFDAVGGRVTRRSLNCLRPQGTLVMYGASSGTSSGVSCISVGRRQVIVRSVSVLEAIRSRESYLRLSHEVLRKLSQNKLRVMVHQYHLSEAFCAHAHLESRRTCGSLVLVSGKQSDPPEETSATRL
eukprot:TRINITY_DN17258_c0_g1_i1.p1 TRINITY_DN17258_c0_g1~~TRINITY_DN17258_c0_g1_i1.p1  ORF type:complete len:390 (-),score=35.90 TRINITY_DN17258_c0_g1_i1:544-1713(-)